MVLSACNDSSSSVAANSFISAPNICLQRGQRSDPLLLDPLETWHKGKWRGNFGKTMGGDVILLSCLSLQKQVWKPLAELLTGACSSVFKTSGLTYFVCLFLCFKWNWIKCTGAALAYFPLRSTPQAILYFGPLFSINEAPNCNALIVQRARKRYCFINVLETNSPQCAKKFHNVVMSCLAQQEVYTGFGFFENSFMMMSYF